MSRHPQLVHEGDDRRGVDPTGEEDPERHVAPQLEADGVGEERGHLLQALGLGHRLRLGVQVPVLEELRPAPLDPHRPARLELVDAAEHRPLGRHVADAHVGVEHLGVDLGPHPGDGEERLDLRGEGDAVRRPGVVERLDPQPVAGEEEPAPRAVPEGEGEHAVQERQKGVAALLVEPQEDLGVGLGAEGAAARLQLLFELQEVVDLAVVGDRDRAVRGRHRPAAAPGGVEDGQPPVGEPERAVGEDPGVVRPAVDHPVRHRSHLVAGDRPARPEAVQPRNPAHASLLAGNGRTPARARRQAKTGPSPSLTPQRGTGSPSTPPRR